MCTVTFIARRNGYALGMNRDEQVTRVAGLPPRLRRINGRQVLFPSEPGGGTWIALNESKATFALINWYSVKTRVKGGSVSRGEVVRAVCTAESGAAADRQLGNLPLHRINPFRLIGVFPESREIIEWRWNLKSLARRERLWGTQQWISSGYDESTAQLVRGRTFRVAQRQKSAGTLDWLRRLHRSHAPECGPFSTCMHRADALTVSFTEVVVSGRNGRMRYLAGTPCLKTTETREHIRS